MRIVNHNHGFQCLCLAALILLRASFCFCYCYSIGNNQGGRHHVATVRSTPTTMLMSPSAVAVASLGQGQGQVRRRLRARGGSIKRMGIMGLGMNQSREYQHRAEFQRGMITQEYFDKLERMSGKDYRWIKPLDKAPVSKALKYVQCSAVQSVD
jgi:hypothetical protein